MANQGKKDEGWGIWLAIIILFWLGLWPIALFLLFTKLFGGDEKKHQSAPPLSGIPYAPQDDTAGTKARRGAKKVMRSPTVKKSNANMLKIFGFFLALGGVFAIADPASALIAGYSYAWEEFFQMLALVVGGGAMLASGLSMDRGMKRYAKYLAVLGDREAMPVEELARVTGVSQRRVEKDLEKMIDKGYFGGRAYLNMELGYFFRSGQANVTWKEQQQKQAQPQTPKEAEEGYSGILRNIRRANDRIADPVLTEKISRLEAITAKIFRAVEEDPKKRAKIDTFLNYYLPTTQKLLDSYAEFEATGIEGDNLRQAKDRIQKTMDSIVAGFEHQLDELYKADAMDVDSDIRVMERMLHRDTASVEKDFGLGKAAPATAKSTEPEGGTAIQTQEK